MKNAYVEGSRHIINQHMSPKERIPTPPDYFNEALRILDNDMTIIPQREHLAALWGLVVGLSRRLTQARVEWSDHRYAAMRKGRRRSLTLPAGSGLVHNGRNSLPRSE